MSNGAFFLFETKMLIRHSTLAQCLNATFFSFLFKISLCVVSSMSRSMALEMRQYLTKCIGCRTYLCHFFEMKANNKTLFTNIWITTQQQGGKKEPNECKKQQPNHFSSYFDLKTHKFRVSIVHSYKFSFLLILFFSIQEIISSYNRSVSVENIFRSIFEFFFFKQEEPKNQFEYVKFSISMKQMNEERNKKRDCNN